MVDFAYPRLVLRAGLVGHRPEHLGISVELLARRIATVLDSIEEAARIVGAQSAGLYAPEPPLFRLTTGLARGAESIGAEVALARSWQLQSVIAFDRHRYADREVAACGREEAAAYRRRYVTLLHRSSSVLEIQGAGTGGLRRDGYELAAEVIIAQCDVLVGVWSGQTAEEAGGCQGFMRTALQHGLPVVWIHAMRAEDNMRLYLPGIGEAPDPAMLTAWLSNSLRLHRHPCAARDSKPDAQQRWREYIDEQGARPGWFMPCFQYLLMLGGRARPSWPLRNIESANRWRTNWHRYRQALMAVDPAAARHVSDVLWPAFQRSEHLAERYGRAYRGGHVLVYLLAILAVIAGLSGYVFSHIRTWLVAIELPLILLMLGTIRTAHRNRWRQRWLEYRRVADQLRQARMGLWAGQAQSPGAGHPASGWDDWYVRACMRQLPLINAAANPDYVRLAMTILGELEITERQRAMHKAATVQRRVSRRLRKAETGLLGLLIAASLAYLVVNGVDPGQIRHYVDGSELDDARRWGRQVSGMMPFLSSIVPAIVAVLIGVRSHSDCTAQEEHTRETSEQWQTPEDGVEQWHAAEAATPDFEDLLDLGKKMRAVQGRREIT